MTILKQGKQGLPLYKIYLLLFLITLLPRLLLFAGIYINNFPEGFWVYDSYGYWQIAHNLIENQSFSQSYIAPIEPDFFRTPLYPFFLMICQLLSPGPLLPILLQIILSGFTTLVIYKTSFTLFSNRIAALIAALLYTIEPGSIVFCNLILSDTIHVFLFSLFVFHLVSFLKSNHARSLNYSSVFLGLSILCRPVSIYLSIIIFLLLVILKFKFYKMILKATLFFLLILFPWLFRNAHVFGSPFICLIGDHILLNYHAPSVMSEKENISFSEAQNKMRMQSLNTFKGNSKKEVINYASHAKSTSLAYISENPGIYIKQHVLGAFSILIKPVRGYLDAQLGLVKGYQSVTAGELPLNKKLWKSFLALSSPLSFAIVILQIFMLLSIYIGIIPGLNLLRQINILYPIIVIILIAYFANMIVPPFNEGRLRLPLFPVIAIVGIAGLVQLFEKNKFKTSSAGLKK